MERSKQCKNCEFNSNGICIGHGEIYDYGTQITDDTQCCESWGANLEFFAYETTNAPRFLREAFNDCIISYSSFSSLLDDYVEGKGVPINIFDAVKAIYGISMVDIAILLDVTFGVVYRAKTKGFAKKRIDQFSKGLFIDGELLQKTSTNDFDKLKKSSEKFWSQADISKKLESMPNWKKELSKTICSYLNCPINLAKDFSRVDKLYWTNEMSTDDFTESEKKLINYVVKHGEYKKQVYKIEYFLDLACRPHLSVVYVDSKNVTK